MVHRLADGVDPSVITTAEATAGSVPGVIHAHARALDRVNPAGRHRRLDRAEYDCSRRRRRRPERCRHYCAAAPGSRQPDLDQARRQAKQSAAPAGEMGRIGPRSLVFSGVTPVPRGDRGRGLPGDQRGPGPLSGAAVRAADHARRPPPPDGPGPRWRSRPPRPRIRRTAGGTSWASARAAAMRIWRCRPVAQPQQGGLPGTRWPRHHADASRGNPGGDPIEDPAASPHDGHPVQLDRHRRPLIHLAAPSRFRVKPAPSEPPRQTGPGRPVSRQR